MANDGWPVWNTVTTATNTTATGYYINVPVTTPHVITYGDGSGSRAYIPDYSPRSLAEDEMAWLRRRITEVTDLFPVAA